MGSRLDRARSLLAYWYELAVATTNAGTPEQDALISIHTHGRAATSAPRNRSWQRLSNYVPPDGPVAPVDVAMARAIVAAPWTVLWHRDRCVENSAAMRKPYAERRAEAARVAQTRRRFVNMSTASRFPLPVAAGQPICTEVACTGPLAVHYTGLFSLQTKRHCMERDDNWHPFHLPAEAIT